MLSSRHSHWACNASAWLILGGLLLGVVWSTMAQQPPASKKKVSTRQGICGTVTELVGNHMPQVVENGKKPASTAGLPVIREVAIYPVFSMAQAEMTDEGFVRSVKDLKPIQTVKTDKKGKFCVYGLPTGTYSVLIREPKGLYASVFDGQSNLNPVTVGKGRATIIQINITHQAAF